METKEFPTEDVLSVVTGRIVSERGMEALYDVLNWMSGGDLYTHQLPRVGREATKYLVKIYPVLLNACDESEKVREHNWKKWRKTWIDRYGPSIDVPKLPWITN